MIILFLIGLCLAERGGIDDIELNVMAVQPEISPDQIL
jgi:hypothetical protein